MNEIFLDFDSFPVKIDFTKQNQAFEKEQILTKHAVFIEYKPNHFASKDILFHANRSSVHSNHKDFLTPYLNENYLIDLIMALKRKQIITFEERVQWYLPSLKDAKEFPNIFNKKYDVNRTGTSNFYWLKDKDLKESTNFAFIIDGISGSNSAVSIGGVAPCFCTCSPLTERELRIEKINESFKNWRWT